MPHVDPDVQFQLFSRTKYKRVKRRNGLWGHKADITCASLVWLMTAVVPKPKLLRRIGSAPGEKFDAAPNKISRI